MTIKRFLALNIKPLLFCALWALVFFICGGKWYVGLSIGMAIVILATLIF